MSKWKIGCGGLVLAVVVLFAIVFWRAYEATRSESILVRNETGETIQVSDDFYGICIGGKYIGPRTTIEVRKGPDFLCDSPALIISGSAIGEVSCDWERAKSRQPVLVAIGHVGCFGEIPSTPVSPPRAYPSPTPNR